MSSSLVGPFVGFHHQALLIAGEWVMDTWCVAGVYVLTYPPACALPVLACASAMWPAGKGNVGYGANVGSNHTGKAPDQELRPGEGCVLRVALHARWLLSPCATTPHTTATGCVFG